MESIKIKQLKLTVAKWEEKLSAENIRFHIILNTFLPLMNYETDNCTFGEIKGKNICQFSFQYRIQGDC